MRRDRESANLDVLRATAVLLVLVAHVCIFFGGADRGVLNPRSLGILGVLFFFVHTSLVLMFSLERQESRYGPRFRAARFLTRRVFRIYPISLFAVAVICLFRLPSSHLGVHSLQFVPPDALTLVSNALLAQNLVDRPSILGVMWSLPYEMQMYVLLPALFLLVSRVRSVGPLVGLWAAAVFVAFIQPRVSHVPDFFQYVPCFLPGIIAFYLSPRTRASLPFWLFPVMLAVLSGIYMFLWEPTATGILYGSFVCITLGMMLPRFVEVANPGIRRVSHEIAKYSYGIYITHYFAMWVAFMAVPGITMVARAVLFVAVLVALPVVLFHAIESPMIGVGARLAGRFPAWAPEPVPEVAEAAPSATPAG